MDHDSGSNPSNLDQSGQINISGNATLGAVQAGVGSTQHVGNITQVGGQDQDLGKLVTELASAVNALKGEVPEAVVSEGADLADSVVAEAGKEEPDKDRLARRLERVRTWAESLGRVAEPLIPLVAKIAAELTR